VLLTHSSSSKKLHKLEFSQKKKQSHVKKLLSLIVVFSLTGCGGSNDSPSTQNQTDQNEPTVNDGGNNSAGNNSGNTQSLLGTWFFCADIPAEDLDEDDIYFSQSQTYIFNDNATYSYSIDYYQQLNCQGGASANLTENSSSYQVVGTRVSIQGFNTLEVDFGNLPYNEYFYVDGNILYPGAVFPEIGLTVPLTIAFNRQ